MRYIVVFDTNILLSALFSNTGSPFRCLALAKVGQVESVTCQEILDEFAEKLLIKFKFSEEKVQESVSDVRAYSRLVKIFGNLQAVEADPDDDMVVECAMVANATYIVTGDKHLLRLGHFQHIAIMKATEFINLLTLQ
jgi:uncharacterized protein